LHLTIQHREGASAKRKMDTGKAAKKWDIMYTKVLCFVQTHKHVRIPISTPELKKMNEWWRGQLKRIKHGTIQQEKINVIHGLIDPDETGKRTQHGMAWDRLFLKLQDRKKKLGHLAAHFSEDKELFNWVVDQRRHASQGTLHQGRMTKLQDLGLALSVYNQKIHFGNQPRWIHTGKGGNHMAQVGNTPLPKVTRKTKQETTGKKVVSHVLIKWSSNKMLEWVCSNQVGDLVSSNFGRGKKREVTSPQAAKARRRKVHNNQLNIYHSRSKFQALFKVNGAVAVDRYLSQLRKNGISDMPPNSISFFLEYVSSLSVDSHPVLYEVLVNFYSSIVPSV
jgi:hypothetical protein